MAGIPVVIVGELTYQGLTVGGGPMPPGQGGQPPGIWGGPGSLPPWAAHPIAPGGQPGQPPGIWGGGNVPMPTPPIYIVIPPGFIDAHPEHPIVIPIPPGIWGPTDPRPSHPIVIPPDLGIWGPTDPRPSHPIVIPPPTPTNPPRPAHPIVLPDPPVDGGPGEPPEVMENWDVVAYWTEEGGWAVAVVPTGDQPVPTPSAT